MYFLPSTMMSIALLCFLAASNAGIIPQADLILGPSNSLRTSPVQPRYFLYNFLQAEPNRPVPLVGFPYGQPGSSYVTSSLNYYGAPLYDYRIQLNPLYAGLQPSFIPSYTPQQPISTTQKPINEDGIEKFDEKVDPSPLELSSDEDSSQDNDSVVIEALD